MTIAAVIWLGYEFWRLLWQPGHIFGYNVWPGAIDFKQRYIEVNTWFSGRPVYGHIQVASYPPASYAMLWPLMGWLSLKQALWLFVGTLVVATGYLIYLAIHTSGAVTRLERLFPRRPQ